jgi:MFS family permease
VSGGLIALVLVSVATSGLIYVVPLVLAGPGGSTAVESGLALSALSLAMLGVAPLAGVLADRLGPGRVARAGAVVAAAGLLILLPLDAGWGAAGLSWRLAVVGAGAALFVGPNQAALMTAAPRSLLGSTAGSSGAARAVGFGLGPAVVTAAWAAADYSSAGLQWAVGVLLAGVVLAVVSLQVSAGQHPADNGAEP